ncbi:MAG: histidine phosphatase family protein [Micropruina sp.]|uniref:histidine phosphatase family protein n=1 Tax=Micropruina sp. TaxID=2737536 RepID=UPI0039E4A8B0
MRLLLARHGRTASNVAALLDTAPPGPDLDDLGRAQAEVLATRLAGHRVDAVYSSDLVRAVQTAAPAVRSFGVAHREIPGLREISAGDDEMSPDVLRYLTALRAWGEGDHSVRIPGGEDGVEFLARYGAAIRQIAEAGHETVLVVSHGAAIRTWAGFVMPVVHRHLGHGGMPNTTVIVADGDPDAGWTLRGIDFPASDPQDGFAALGDRRG